MNAVRQSRNQKKPPPPFPPPSRGRVRVGGIFSINKNFKGCTQVVQIHSDKKQTDNQGIRGSPGLMQADRLSITLQDFL
jgi:hypothetical protein